MDIAITGSSGTIGSAVVAAVEARGDRAIRVVRSSPTTDQIGWDPANGTIDAAGFEGLDAVVHLAAAGIGSQRWTDAYKQEILRTTPTPTPTPAHFRLQYVAVAS